MEIQHMQYVTTELAQIEKFIKNSDAHFDDIIEHVEDKLFDLRRYAQTNGVPIHIDAYTLVCKYHDEPEEENSYYEEEDSSSYYEEEYSSSYYEEDEDN